MSISILICLDEHKIYCTDFIRNHVLYSENQCHARLPSSSVILRNRNVLRIIYYMARKNCIWFIVYI